MNRVWNRAAWLARGGDKVLNALIAIALIIALLFGGFGVWDTWRIYHNSALGSFAQYKPTASGLDSPNPILEELQAINPDVCAWLTVDGTNIDYPVVQGEDNMTYLNWAPDLTFSLSGSIFLDYQNSNDFTDRYSLIYGHHMESKTMFGELPEFTDAEFFNEHTTGTVFTAQHTYYVEWFACLETDAYDKMIYFPTNYKSRYTITKLLSYIQDNATQFRDIGVTDLDRLIALTTCTTATTDGRIVLIGRLA